MVLQNSFISGFFPRLDWNMTTTTAASVMAATETPKQTKVEDTVGPLPNIKLFIPKGGFQPPKHGLPINPSPHNRTPSDPAIQAPFTKPDPAIQTPFPWTKSTPAEKSPPLENTNQTPLERTAPTPIIKQNQTPITRQNSIPLEKLTQTPLEKTTQTPLDKTTQTPLEKKSKASFDKLPEFSFEAKAKETQKSREIAIQTEQNDDLDCHYCRGCQKRLSLRSDSSTSTVSSAGSSPKIPASPKKVSKFGRRFKIGVLQRGSAKPIKAKDTKSKEKDDEWKVTEKAAKRLTRKIDYEMVSPTDHWADE